MATTELRAIVERQLARIDESARTSLWKLRDQPHLQVATSAGGYWVRSTNPEVNLHELLRRTIPQATLFEMVDGGVDESPLLREVSKRLPSEVLPTLTWRAINEFTSLELPVVGYPGGSANSIAIELVPSSEFGPAAAVLCSLGDWCDFVTSQLQVRFQHCKFAVREDGMAFVVGSPVPSLRGIRYRVRNGIAIPAGWRWSPDVSAEVLRLRYGVTMDDLLLLSRNRSAEVINESDFCAATRASVRETLASLQSEEPTSE